MGKKFMDFFKTPGGIGKFGIYTAVVGITTGWLVFPYALDYLLGKRLALVEGTEARDLWTKLPPLVTSIYLFNVTNPNEVQNGAKPIVEEIGPYCYLAYKEKVNLVDDEEDDSVSYTAKSTWYKLPPSPDDFKKTGAVCHQTLTGNEIIVQPNAFLMAILLKARNDFPAPLLNFVNAALPGIWGRLTNVFLTATASELIFDGILINCTSTVLLPRVICVAVEQNSKALVTLAKNIYLFSFFGGQNGTLNEYRLTVKRGSKDLMDVGRITQIDGNTELPFWKGECNKLYGTDSTIFPPHRRRDNASFTAYTSELCRVVKGTYVGDAVVNGIKGHEYVVSLGKGGEDPISRCYCSKPKKCPPGALDVTSCLGAPLTATFPHFFDAPEFQNDVIGLNPDRAKHATYGILQETSGVPLQGRRRIQISIELKKIPFVGVTSKLKGYMCPLLWIEEAFDLEGDLLSMVKYQLVLGLTAMSAVKWGLLILGAGLSVFGGVGRYMNGPNWKKIEKYGDGDSPRDPPVGKDLSKLEQGNKYQKFQDVKTDQTSRSIMFYKEKFRKTDTSMQTEPLFYAVKNGRSLQPQRIVMENIPKQKEEVQTIIPLFTDEVDPDSQSQPFQENKHNLKSRLDSPENVDQRFPLLNIVNNDVAGYPVVKPISYNGVMSNVEESKTLEIKSARILSEMQEDSKLKTAIEKLNARLNALERMKENLSRASQNHAKVKRREDLEEEDTKYAIKVVRKDGFEEKKLKLEQEAEELGLDRKLFKSEDGGNREDALKARNLKLEEEARKLKVELNVLKGLKNGQFPLKNHRRDDWSQTDHTSTLYPSQDNFDTDVKNDNLSKGTIKNNILTHQNSHLDVLQKPSVRFQQKINSNGINVENRSFVDPQKKSEQEFQLLNSREKFFGRQGDTNVKNMSEKVTAIMPVVSDGSELGAQNERNTLSRIQGDTASKMTLHDSMQLSGSRNFENEVLKVLRGEVKSQMREHGILGDGSGRLPPKLSNFSLNDTGKQIREIQAAGEPTEIELPNVGEDRKIAKNAREFSKPNNISREKVSNELDSLRKKYYDDLSTTASSKRRRIQASSSTEDSSDHVATEETTLDEDSNIEELDDQLRKLSPEAEKEEKDKLPDLKKVKIKKNWKKVLTIVHTSKQIYNYRQLEKRQLFGESVEDYRDDQNLEDGEEEADEEGPGEAIRKVSIRTDEGPGETMRNDEGPGVAMRKVSTRTSSMETDSIEDYDSLSRSVENTPSMTRRRPSLKYMERVASIDSLLDSEGLSDATITVTGAFSGGILRRRLSRDSSLSDNDNV